MNTLKRMLLLSFLLSTLYVGQAQAQRATGYHIQSNSKIQPVVSVSLSFFSGIPDFIGLELTLKALEPLRIDAGVSSLIFGLSGYARAGYAFSLSDGRSELDVTGWTIKFIPMLGVRRIEGGVFSQTKRTGLTVTGSLESTYWFARHFGVEAKLTAGAGYLNNARNGASPLVPDVRLSLGLAF